MSTVEDDNYNISSFDCGDLLTRRDPANRLGLAIQQRGGCHTFSMLVTPALSLRASKIDGRNLVFLVPVLLGQRQGSRISCKLCGAWHVLRMGIPFYASSQAKAIPIIRGGRRWEAAGVYLRPLPGAVGEKIHSYNNGVVSRGVEVCAV